MTWDWLPVVWAATLLILVVNYWRSLCLGVSAVYKADNPAEFGLLLDAGPI